MGCERRYEGKRGGVFLHLNLFLIDYFDDCIDMKKCS